MTEPTRVLLKLAGCIIIMQSGTIFGQNEFLSCLVAIMGFRLIESGFEK